jgi:hypothetical protein
LGVPIPERVDGGRACPLPAVAAVAAVAAATSAEVRGARSGCEDVAAGDSLLWTPMNCDTDPNRCIVALYRTPWDLPKS